eukprot:scaffold1184_cov98-Skeletonema_dohrnii-CCMP3373.AAC.1
MANYNEFLEAVERHIHSVRYEIGAREKSWQLAAVSDASSGHLRGCSDADTSMQCLSREKDASILSWPTIIGH